MLLKLKFPLVVFVFWRVQRFLLADDKSIFEAFMVPRACAARLAALTPKTNIKSEFYAAHNKFLQRYRAAGRET
jgi:hypothetical protein